MNKSVVSDIPFNKIADMIIPLTEAKSKARINLLAELYTIRDWLRLIEEEKKEAKKKNEN